MFHLIVSKFIADKKKKQLEKVKEVFASTQYELHATESKQQLHDTVKELTSQKGNSVIILGGDGTLHDALNAFEDFDNNSLGLIPLGTGNDFAASANVPLSCEKAARLIVDNPPRHIDFAQFDNGLRCINAFGMGIDVDVLKRTYAGKSVKRTKYLRALIISLMKFKSYNFTAKFDGKEERHFGLIAATGNGRQFGGGIKICPDAKIDDGYLDLIIVDYLSKFKIIGAFAKLMKGKINKLKQATVRRVKEVEFIPDDESFTLQADGELYDNVAIKARVISGKLNFYTI